MALHCFRVEFVDHPGALAAFGSAIAGCGGNIISVDVQEIDGTSVADDIVVETGPAAPAALRQALLAAGADSVFSTSVVPRVTDALVRCLDAVGQLAADVVGDRRGAAAPLLAVLLGADHVQVAGAAEAGTAGAARQALVSTSPVMERDADGWLLALPAPEVDPHLVYLVARRGGLRFSATEVARARAALRVAGALAAAPAGR